MRLALLLAAAGLAPSAHAFAPLTPKQMGAGRRSRETRVIDIAAADVDSPNFGVRTEAARRHTSSAATLQAAIDLSTLLPVVAAAVVAAAAAMQVAVLLLAVFVALAALAVLAASLAGTAALPPTGIQRQTALSASMAGVERHLRDGCSLPDGCRELPVVSRAADGRFHLEPVLAAVHAAAMGAVALTSAFRSRSVRADLAAFHNSSAIYGTNNGYFEVDERCLKGVRRGPPSPNQPHQHKHSNYR